MPLRFTTRDGNPASGSDAIFPIVKSVDGKIYQIGTGFFICTNGIFLTASHVLRDVLDTSGVQKSQIGIIQFIHNNQYIIRPIVRCCFHPSSDIACGVIAEAKHNETGELLLNKCMILSTKEQPIQSTIATWAFPETHIDTNGSVQTLRFNPSFSEGVLEEHFPEGRDSHLLSFPCYQGTAYLKGGTSGGPVINLENGRVFAINCSSYEGLNLSFYASLTNVLDLTVSKVVIGTEHFDVVSLANLAELRYLDCN